jgi:hypothetical protein
MDMSTGASRMELRKPDTTASKGSSLPPSATKAAPIHESTILRPIHKKFYPSSSFPHQRPNRLLPSPLDSAFVSASSNDQTSRKQPVAQDFIAIERTTATAAHRAPNAARGKLVDLHPSRERSAGRTQRNDSEMTKPLLTTSPQQRADAVKHLWSQDVLLDGICNNVERDGSPPLLSFRGTAERPVGASTDVDEKARWVSLRGRRKLNLTSCAVSTTTLSPSDAQRAREETARQGKSLLNKPAWWLWLPQLLEPSPIISGIEVSSHIAKIPPNADAKRVTQSLSHDPIDL